jgi:tetratricopeptide (TPR) repeat protein
MQFNSQALKRNPQFAQAHFDTGNALLELKRHEEALASYDRALAIQPDLVQALSNRSNALFELKRHEEALASCDRALAIQPAFAQALSNRGNALFNLTRYEEALASYDRALAIQPDFARVLSNRGNALFELKRHEEALASHDQALAIQPDFAEAHHGRATLLSTFGRIKEAQHVLEKAIELAPRKALFYNSLAFSKRFVDGDPHLTLVEALARDMESLPEEDQIYLHFVMGKVYADLGQHERSFSHLIEGNALKRKQIVYDEAAALAQVERMRQLFTAEAMRKGRGFGDRSTVPVFIIGMPRSGTTLVEQILASHPKIYGAGELDDFQIVLANLRGSVRSRGGFGAEDLRQIGARYLERVRAIAPAAERITDKMPGNYLYAGLIHLALPNARIIHIRRDPLDTCLSCFSLLFTRNLLPFTYDLTELGRYYRAYATLMEHWREVLPLEQMLEVHYEELVANFEPLVRRIVAYCGLEWDDACLEFNKTQRPVRTASVVQVREPIYRSSIRRWRPYEGMLRPLIKALEGA